MLHGSTHIAQKCATHKAFNATTRECLFRIPLRGGQAKNALHLLTANGRYSLKKRELLAVPRQRFNVIMLPLKKTFVNSILEEEKCSQIVDISVTLC